MKSRKPFLLRISPALYDELEAWAQQEFRSVNGQIEYLLKEAVAKHRRPALRRRPDSRTGRSTAAPAALVVALFTQHRGHVSNVPDNVGHVSNVPGTRPPGIVPHFILLSQS